MAEYKSIDGIKYDRPLLGLADYLVSGTGDGRISLDDAQHIWNQAMADGKITPVERRTVEYIVQEYNCTPKAKELLEGKLFKVIDGVQYDLALLMAADQFSSGKGSGRISFDDAGVIWALVDADGIVTDVERRTVQYILAHYNCTEKAQEFFEEELNGH